MIQHGQVVQGVGRLRMVGTVELLADGQAALVERLGLSVLPLDGIQEAQVDEGLGHAGMVGTVELLLDLQAALPGHDRRAVLAQLAGQDGQGVS